MADRAEFMEKVRHRTRTGKYRPTHAPDVAWTREGAPPERESIEDPPARFLEELEAVGGHGRRVRNITEARKYVLSLAREREAKLLLRWDVEELDRMKADGPLREAGVEVAVWNDDLADPKDVAARADIGLSTAAWAIAETGSLVLEGGPGRGRVVTLLPPCYVAVLYARKVLSKVPEAIGRYAEGGNVPANVCFHTGPSRSGDIEMTLAIGVHGPGDVHVLLVG